MFCLLKGLKWDKFCIDEDFGALKILPLNPKTKIAQILSGLLYIECDHYIMETVVNHAFNALIYFINKTLRNVLKY